MPRRLSGPYGFLNPDERLRLLLMAVERGDEGETRRILTSVPHAFLQGPNPSFSLLLSRLFDVLDRFQTAVTELEHRREKARLREEAVQLAVDGAGRSARAFNEAFALSANPKAVFVLTSPLQERADRLRTKARQAVRDLDAMIKGAWRGFERFCRLQLDVEPGLVAGLLPVQDPSPPERREVGPDKATIEECYGFLLSIWAPDAES